MAPHPNVSNATHPAASMKFLQKAETCVTPIKVAKARESIAVDSKAQHLKPANSKQQSRVTKVAKKSVSKEVISDSEDEHSEAAADDDGDYGKHVLPSLCRLCSLKIAIPLC